MLKAKETNGVLIKDKIYLIGGNNGKDLSKIEVYDLLTNKWYVEGSLFEGINSNAIATHNGMIYIYKRGQMITYNTTLKILKKYSIEVDIIQPEIFIKKEKLFLVGGYVKSEHSKRPSRRVIKINLNEFSKTYIKKEKEFNQF